MIRKLSTLPISLLMLIACVEQPRDRSRAYEEGKSYFPVSNTATGETSGGTVSTYTPPASGTLTPPTQTAVDPLLAETTHCQFSKDGNTYYRYQKTTHIESAFNLCQGQTQKEVIYLQFQAVIPRDRVCFIPSYSGQSTGGKTTYTGNPTCIYIDQATKIVKMSLTLFPQTPYIDGVIILKDASYNFPYPLPPNNVDAFFFAMDAQLQHPELLRTYLSYNYYVFVPFQT